MKGYYPQVIQALREAGWRKLRNGKGSHEIWVNGSGNKQTTVPFNCYSRHTANGVMESAGLAKKF